MKRLKTILFFTLLFSAHLIKAQDFNFYANCVDTAYLNESFKVVFVVENARQLSDIRPPQFTGFTVTGQQQGSSSVNINGKISQSYNLTFYLQAQKEGALTINEASAHINGKTEKTQVLNVFIKPAREKVNQPSVKNHDNAKPNNVNNYDDDIFIRLSTNNTRPYIGEAINLNAKLYFRVGIRELYPTALPEFKGFWNEEHKVSQEEREVETYNGVQYYTVNLNRYTLMPLKEGPLTINPFEFNSIIEAQVLKSHPFWGQYYDYDVVNHKVKCNTIYIEAKALPETGKPENFNGAVGSFKLSTSLDKNAVDYDEAISFKAKISGTGNFTMFETPQINLSNDFEVYDPEIIENINSIHGSKTYNFIIVPKTPGEFKVSPISFSYFDVQNKSYKTLIADTITLNIGGELPEEIIAELEEDSLPVNEIYSIVDKPSLNKAKNSFYGSSKYYTSLVSPLFLFAFIFLAKRIRDNSLVDVVALKRRRASKEAQKRLRKAYGFLNQKDKEAFYTEIFDALNGYVSDKLNITQADLSKELINIRFEEKNVSTHLATQFTQVLSNAEAALYAPASASKMQDDYEIAKKWIVEIEHEIT